MQRRACKEPLYFLLCQSEGSDMELVCACKRIFTTSMGVTTATASVTPESSPAKNTCEFCVRVNEWMSG